ncbi:MAG: hypothetical protein ABI543_12340 [Ignavibacteria bacterium]
MEKSTLVEILRTFSKEELASFGDLTSSPYYNKKTNVTKLYRALKKFAPDFSPEKITKEEMWKQIFPGKEYNYGIMKNLIYELNRLAVKFIELETAAKKTFENDLNQMHGYRSKNLKSLFIKKLAESRKNLDSQLINNQTHYYRYMQDYEEMSYLDYDFLFSSGKTDYHSGINKSLILFYCTNQLFHNINSIQYAYNSSAGIDKETHEKTLRVYDDTPHKDPYTDILYASYLAMSGSGDSESYEKLKTVFFENYDKCAKNIQYELAANMINFCRNNAQRGIAEFVKDEFIYVKLVIEDRLYKSTSVGWIDQYMFMHCVMSACRAGRFDWAKKFIEEHNHELIEAVREQYTNYAFITLNLRQSRFDDALHYISKCRNVDDGDKLNIKVFEFNAYYELGYYDELKALADSANHMLRSDKFFSKEEKAGYKMYVTAISRLMDYKCKVGKRQMNENFLEEVVSFINENKMRNKQWLLQKAEELKSIQ